MAKARLHTAHTAEACGAYKVLILLVREGLRIRALSAYLNAD